MIKILKIILIMVIVISAINVANAETIISKAPHIKSGYYVNKNFDLVPNDKTLNKKVVLITIDDGPGKTDRDLINILNKHNAKAIFFINGIKDKDFKGNIKMISDAGLTIGNHTWNHLNLKKSRESLIKKEIIDTNKLIVKLTGQSPRFFRPPYGVTNAFAKELVKKEGMIFMNWSGSTLDWEKNSQNEKVFLKNVLDGLHDGEIILMHGHTWTAKYLDNLMTEIEKRGYAFADPANIIE